MGGSGRPEHAVVRAGLARRLVVANVVGASLMLVYFDLTAAVPLKRLTRVEVFVNDFAFLIAFFVVTIPLAIWIDRRRSGSWLAWIDEQRDPTDEERHQILVAPWEASKFLLPFYFVASVAVFGLNYAGHHSFFTALRIFIGINLGGLCTLALAYLLVERHLRPMVARALANHSFHTTASLSVRRRLLLAWGLGSGIPVLFMAVIPLGRTGPQEYPVAVPLLFMAATALAAGSVIHWNLANTLAVPIDEVRGALGRVRAGDLDVETPVNDAGEVGLLQAGFNEMVAGLRERQLLQDLFGRHVGEEVARHALARGVSLDGEQTEVTVFFVDLIGSTTLVETKRPVEVMAMLNAFFDTIVRAVAAQGGWVNKFEGDAALCVFGAPDAQPDHAHRALRAAVQLRDGLRALQARYPDLDAAIGLSSGIVVAGNVGAEQRYEYTVIGSPVNEAARLTEHAKQRPARAIASGSVIEHANDTRGQWTPIGEVLLRGFDRPTPIYEPNTAD